MTIDRTVVDQLKEHITSPFGRAKFLERLDNANSRATEIMMLYLEGNSRRDAERVAKASGRLNWLTNHYESQELFAEAAQTAHEGGEFLRAAEFYVKSGMPGAAFSDFMDAGEYSKYVFAS
jgi:hypothetical protein